MPDEQAADLARLELLEFLALRGFVISVAGAATSDCTMRAAAS